MAKGLSLVAYVAADVPDRVIGDPLRLQQILFNLLGNAIKFTETGSVRLSLENAGDGMLRIKVADTGIGLTDEQRSRLFQPFVQADSSTTRRFGGTGLGLSIVRRLAEAMQGGVEVISKPGEGSTFIVTVRLDAAAPAIRVDPTLRGLSLAVALPDADEACAIARYLADAGAEVAIYPDSSFVGIRVAGHDAEIYLPRPYRRDSLVRAVARAVGRAADAMVSTPPRAAPLNGRVLVVDDNSVNRKILARQLELAGATTDSASGGEEALELWRNGRLRPGAGRPADADHGRLRAGAPHPRQRGGRAQAAHADPGRHRQHARRPGTEEPGGRHGRLHHQADRHRAAASHPRCLAEGRCMNQGPNQAYDRDKLVELFGDDPRTLAEVEREFLDTAREAAREIKGTDDFIVIARAAHRLKGASGMIGAAGAAPDRRGRRARGQGGGPVDRAPPARAVRPRGPPRRRAGWTRSRLNHCHPERSEGPLGLQQRSLASLGMTAIGDSGY